MPNYKVVNADQLDADLKSVADAIRERAKTTEKMVFPGGYTNAVTGIPDLLAQRVMNNITEYESEDVLFVTENGFAGASNMRTCSLPNATYIEGWAFNNCWSMSSISIPKCTRISAGSFNSCISIQKVILPSLATIEEKGFNYCTILHTLILPGLTVCKMTGLALDGTPIGGNTENWVGGNIYVPSALVDAYKTETNWSVYADKIVAIEDYPDIVAELTELGYWEG